MPDQLLFSIEVFLNGLMAGVLYAMLVRDGMALFPAAALAILAGGLLLAGRLAPAHALWERAYPYKLHLSVLSVVLAIAALLGGVAMLEGAMLDV